MRLGGPRTHHPPYLSVILHMAACSPPPSASDGCCDGCSLHQLQRRPDLRFSFLIPSSPGGPIQEPRSKRAARREGLKVSLSKELDDRKSASGWLCCFHPVQEVTRAAAQAVNPSFLLRSGMDFLSQAGNSLPSQPRGLLGNLSSRKQMLPPPRCSFLRLVRSSSFRPKQPLTDEQSQRSSQAAARTSEPAIAGPLPGSGMQPCTQPCTALVLRRRFLQLLCSPTKNKAPPEMNR